MPVCLHSKLCNVSQVQFEVEKLPHLCKQNTDEEPTCGKLAMGMHPHVHELGALPNTLIAGTDFSRLNTLPSSSSGAVTWN